MSACPVCAAGDARPLVQQGGHRWLRCSDCGFAWLWPLPTMDEAADIQDAASHGYIEDYARKFASKMRRSRRRARRLARHMTGRRLLDVGSNIGCFVAAAAELGLDATGIEIAPALVAEARRRFPACRFVLGALEESSLPPASFDGVYCSEVIEHVVDVNRFLAAIAAAMAPGAVLYLTTPALREYMRGADPAAWPDFGAPDHKLYFSPGNMRHMLVRHGFENVRLLFNFRRGLKVLARRGARSPQSPR